MMDWDIEYPVMLLGRAGLRVERDSERLTTMPRFGLSGLYNDHLMVDSVGRARHIKEARELAAGIGLLSRLRRWWNWTAPVRVELIFDSELTSVSVDELKERLLVSLAGRPANLAAWDPGIISFEQLKDGLKTAQTFDEVFHLVREFSTIRPELL
jgi:hypothetical protein